MHRAKNVVTLSILGMLAACGGASSPAPTVVPTVVPNVAPVALAGAAQTLEYGAPVTLDGSGSSDANGDTLSYSWTLSARPAGSTAALSGATSARPVFTPDVTGDYSASLTVSDGKAVSNVATVLVTATARTIFVSDGPAVTVGVGSTATIGYAAVTNGDKLSYAWTWASKPAGSNATLSSATAMQAVLTPDLPGTYVASVVASDGTHVSLPAKTTVTVLEAATYQGFVDLVNNGGCNNQASDLYLIDGKYVFAYVSGASCSKQSYRAGLYGLTVAQYLCGQADSVSGAQRNCPDTSVETLFNTAYANHYFEDLGLGYSRVSTFIKPAPLPAGAAALTYQSVAAGAALAPYRTGTSIELARSNAELSALWKLGSFSGAMPVIDYSKQTAVALFYSVTTICDNFRMNNIYTLNGTVVVDWVNRSRVYPSIGYCKALYQPYLQIYTIDLPATAAWPVTLY